jgi:hypothetical protein
MEKTEQTIIVAENFPNLEKGRDIQVQEVDRTPNGQNQKRNTLRHFTIKTVTQHTEQRENSESRRREKTGHI